MNIHLALLDHHPLGDRADEALSFLERQRGQGGGDAAGKARRTQLQVGLLERRGMLTTDRLEARLHVGPPLAEQALAALELTELDQPGLIGIEEPMLLAVHLGQLLLEISDLLPDDPVGAGRGLRSQLSVRLDDQGRTLEMPSHLTPHEFVEFVGAKVALGTAPDAASSPEEIVAGAVVVVVDGAIAPPHPMARDPEITHAAAHQAPEQVVPRLQMARAEPAVVGMQRLRALE